MIHTKKIPATPAQPRQCKAYTKSGYTLSIKWDPHLSEEDNLRNVREALADMIRMQTTSI